MTSRCTHDPEPFFGRHPDPDKRAGMMLSGWRDYVRCRTCGTLGYPGRRRMRWTGPGPADVVAQAEAWNREIAEARP